MHVCACVSACAWVCVRVCVCVCLASYSHEMLFFKIRDLFAFSKIMFLVPRNISSPPWRETDSKHTCSRAPRGFSPALPCPRCFRLVREAALSYPGSPGRCSYRASASSVPCPRGLPGKIPPVFQDPEQAFLEHLHVLGEMHLLFPLCSFALPSHRPSV